MYTLEEIYTKFGRKDYTIMIHLYSGSVSQKEFGDYIIGSIIYTPKLREELENSINKSPMSSTHGNIKFIISLNNLDSIKKLKIKTIGIPSKEIKNVNFYFPTSPYNFTSNQIKILPEPIKINVDFSNTDTDDFCMMINNIKIEDGFMLTPFETLQHLALRLEKEGFSMDWEQYNKLFIDPATGDLCSSVYFYYLRNRLYKGTINDRDKKYYEQMNTLRSQNRMQILNKEFQKATEKVKELGLSFANPVTSHIKLAATFEDINLTNTKFPIWIDYERFIHIFMRHVSEMQVGERNEKKTAFQYRVNNIVRLIQIVLKIVESDIQQHYSTDGETKPFKRHGEEAIYYQGEYFVINIDLNGRLMTFYPISKITKTHL